MVGHFFCAFCERKIVIDDSSEVRIFRLGNELFCSGCEKEITVGIMDRIIDDNSVPKTYRKIFERYLEWMEEKE
jgi:hypothetical protein